MFVCEALHNGQLVATYESLEDEARFLNGFDRDSEFGLENPCAIRQVLQHWTHADELRRGTSRVDRFGRAIAFQLDPSYNAGDPGGAFREIQQIVGFGNGWGSLNDDSRINAMLR